MWRSCLLLAVLENPQGSLAYTEMGDAGASITQTSIIHSPGVFEKSDETKKKLDSRNINRDLNSAMRTALAYASKASSHPRAAWLWWGAVEKGLRNKYFTDWKMGDGETNQFPSNSSTSWPKAILSLLETYMDSEEQGLSMKPKLSHPMEKNTSEMFLLSYPLSFQPVCRSLAFLGPLNSAERPAIVLSNSASSLAKALLCPQHLPFGIYTATRNILPSLFPGPS